MRSPFCPYWSLVLIFAAGVVSASAATNLPPGIEATAARTNLSVNGYHGIWFTLGQRSEHGDKYSGGLGTYTANHSPLAIYAPEVNRTFFVYGGTRPGERHLLIMASFFDHSRNQVPRPTIVHDKGGVDDPHDNPSLSLDDRGYLWGFRQRSGTRPSGTNLSEPTAV
jgi:hypothetical protein